MNKQNNDCMKNEYLNEDGSVNIEKMNQLSESKRWLVLSSFNGEQQDQYLSTLNLLTLEEFEAEVDKIIEKKYRNQ